MSELEEEKKIQQDEVEQDTDEKKSKKVKVTVQTQSRCWWLKFYTEQGDKDNVRRFIEKYGSKYYIHAIQHDKDTNLDDFWEPAIDKPHIHMLILSRNKTSNGVLSKVRLGVLLNQMADVDFQYKKEDTNLLTHEGAIPVNVQQKAYIDMIVYHTHEDYASQKKGLKHTYDRSEVITNIPQDMLDGIYNEYFQFRNQDSIANNKKVLSSELKAQLEEKFMQMGKIGEDFDKVWFSAENQTARLSNGFETLCKKAYKYGLETYRDSEESITHIRCAIFIKGSHNVGKTTSAQKALKQLGVSYISVEGGGAGKLDSVKCSTGAIVVSDTSVPDIMGLSDNKYSFCYRRNSDNPLFCGDYLIITYNADINTYLSDFYSNMLPQTKTALLSRLCCVSVSNMGLVTLDSVSVRGTPSDIQKRLELLDNFLSVFRNEILQYHTASATSEVVATKKAINNLYQKYGGQVELPTCSNPEETLAYFDMQPVDESELPFKD